MKRIMKWAEREYGFTPRIIATLLAGVTLYSSFLTSFAKLDP